MRLCLLSLLFCCFALSCQVSSSVNFKNGYVLSLDSYNDQIKVYWTLNTPEFYIPATVPGGIYTDLMRSGRIGDILQGKADVQTRPYAKMDWTYKGTFILPPDFRQKNVTNIVLFGVDTVANVSVNNNLVGRTNNMFTRYSFPVILKTGHNEIEVKFEPPIAVGQRLDRLYPTAPDCVPEIYHGECHANQLRKMQASFGWDWGPAFPSMGLWKPIQLESYDTAIIRDVAVDIKKLDMRWLVAITVYMETRPMKNLLGTRLEAKLTIGENKDVKLIKKLSDIARLDGQFTATMEMTISEALIDQWWPNGIGKQPLYDLNVGYYDDKYPEERNFKVLKIGFREINFYEKNICDAGNQNQMDQTGNITNIDCEGRTFYFNVNGHPVFMKGTNWIPASILPELGNNKSVVDHLLNSAKAANMNMLRVWGGGVYESDYFYQKCDELGIFLWHDLMFACSMYPDYDEFLESVSEEVQQNIRRLQHHPSVAIWAGNNENEAALRGNWYETKGDFDRYQRQYINLYVHTIRPIVTESDPTRHYLISSPTNGIESEKENYIAQNPYDPRYGDTHYYNYIGPIWSMSTYPHTRFASEYGFQSYPSIYTINTAGVSTIAEADALMKYRQHSPAGDASMLLQIDRYLKAKSGFSSAELSREKIYYSQIVQAESMRIETEFYRQSRFDWLTMGALYWQLNDVWQAPSWSGIEFSGRWKMLHYFAARFFADVLVSPRLTADLSIEIYVINDLLKPIRGNVLIETFEWGNSTSILEERYSVIASPLSVAKLPYTYKLPSESNLRFYRYQLVDTENNKKISPSNFVFPFKPIEVNDKAHDGKEIKIDVAPADALGDKKTFKVHVSSDAMYMFVYLEVDFPGHFSDNGFHLIDETVTLTFETVLDIDANNLKEQLKINSVPPVRSTKAT